MLLLAALLAGGSWNHPISALVVRLASLPAASIVIWRLATRGPPARAALPLALVGAMFAVGLAQLVPLPPQVWSALPGRRDFLGVYAAIGQTPPWLPLSLTPSATWDSLLALVPPAAMVLSVPLLNLDARRRLAAVVAPVAVLGVFLGVAQLLQGQASPLRLYFREDTDAVGLFSNRDFYASMLAAAIPFAVVSGAQLSRGDDARRIFQLVATAAVVLVLVVGLATSKSRAGVLLALPAAAGAAMILLTQAPSRSAGPGAGRATALVAIGAAALGAALVATLAFAPVSARFHEALAGDLRFQLAPTTTALAYRYAPFGAGLGSFEPVYETAENPDHMIGTYAGHAHDDFLEFWLEAGWAALALMAVFFVWYVREAARLIRRRGEPGAELGLAGALVVALLLAYSTVEFPLRTPALATVFAFACGLMVLPREASLVGAELNSTTSQSAAGERGGAVARTALRATISLVAVLAALAFVRQAFVTDALENDTSEKVVRLDPTNPDVLAGAAAQRAETAKSDADFRAAGQLARAALEGSPLEPSALRALSWEADHEGRKAEGLAIMTLAGRLTQRDNYIHGTLFWDAVERRDWQAAFLNVDPVLRRVPDLGPAFFPAMIEALSDPGARQAAVSRLQWRPDWRGPFLASLAHQPESGPSARLVFEALNATKAPLSSAEQTLLIDSLISGGDYPGAKDEWRRFLPAAARRQAALLYDGEFKGLPGGPPFNWTFVDEDGAVSEIGAAPDGQPALHLQYPAGHANTLLSQTLVLPPGAYRMSGQLLFDGSARGDQLVWRIECTDGTTLAVLRQGAAGRGWSSLQVDFVRPAAGCSAQRLELGSIAQDAFDPLEAYARDLSIASCGADGKDAGTTPDAKPACGDSDAAH